MSSFRSTFSTYALMTAQVSALKEHFTTKLLKSASFASQALSIRLRARLPALSAAGGPTTINTGRHPKDSAIRATRANTLPRSAPQCASTAKLGFTVQSALPPP